MPFVINQMNRTITLLALKFASLHRHDYDPEIFAGTQVPILLIGTKVDMADSVQKSRRRSGICEECGADEITMVN